jgi:hypothetical protein
MTTKGQMKYQFDADVPSGHRRFLLDLRQKNHWPLSTLTPRETILLGCDSGDKEVIINAVRAFDWAILMIQEGCPEAEGDKKTKKRPRKERHVPIDVPVTEQPEAPCVVETSPITPPQA